MRPHFLLKAAPNSYYYSLSSEQLVTVLYCFLKGFQTPTVQSVVIGRYFCPSHSFISASIDLFLLHITVIL